ncbi:ATP-binding cassette domain-containing protein [Membranicola marinus]|uniref:ATP-binding cassette domain-containing protein n=1 Tax=Membranihabitans marinus TaxID=1227546 RepID=A0A953HPL3_9BACT|nr:ATP-binding cassette domain-containing protein [Membranihabitans marinus]MBY5958478.1 ATP-binding cassette domain-containing protein [Membranihabitans marinus]
MSIRVHNLTKYYGDQKAVDQISFEIQTGEVIGFLGPNGAGKSTTMKMMTGYMAPSDGTIYIEGVNVAEEPLTIKRKIGYLPENNPLYTDMPIIDYLHFCAEIQGVHRDAIKERIRQMIDLCGLDDEKHKYIHELSKGYRQRVGLAQSIIHDPDVLIFDEPTTGLDPNQIIEIRKLIKKLGEEKTVILSSHILSEVEATCDRILIINQGKIVADGTAESLRKQAEGEEILHVQLGTIAGESAEMGLRSLPTVASVEKLDKKTNYFKVSSEHGKTSRKAIFDLCVKNQWYLMELTPMETRLEDVFRNVTSQPGTKNREDYMQNTKMDIA